MVTILMTQRAWTSPSPPNVCLDFWTSTYQAIDDWDASGRWGSPASPCSPSAS